MTCSLDPNCTLSPTASLQIIPSNHWTVRPLLTGNENSNRACILRCHTLQTEFLLLAWVWLWVQFTDDTPLHPPPPPVLHLGEAEREWVSQTDTWIWVPILPTGYTTPKVTQPLKNSESESPIPGLGWGVYLPGAWPRVISLKVFFSFCFYLTGSKLFALSLGLFLDFTYFVWGSPGSVVLKVWGLDQEH